MTQLEAMKVLMNTTYGIFPTDRAILEEAVNIAIQALNKVGSCKEKNYQCYCALGYPNENYKRKNGNWKCLDRFEFVEESSRGMTHCRRKENHNEQ